MSNTGEPRSEKRGNARRACTRPVKLQVQSQDLEGVHRDVSSSGAYIVTGADLVLQLIREDESGRRKVTARIVRFERLPGDCTGIAVEYLPEE